MNDHARFAPSSAHRWMNCTASVDAAACYTDIHGEAAAEGTAAHWLLEQCLLNGGNPIDHLGKTIKVIEGASERKFVVTRDMARDISLGVDTIRDIVKAPGWSGVESRVDLSFIEVGQFGTCDLWHWAQSGVLTIVDFKYGRKDVDVENNQQLQLYAAGVMNAPPAPANILSSVRLVVVQPRSVAAVPRVKVWTVTPDVIEKTALLAQERILEANRAPYYEMGPWCEYCPALGDCPKSNREIVSLGPLLASIDMSPDKAARVLARRDLIEKILDKAEKCALDALMHGQKLPELGLFTQRKHRQWRDPEIAKQALVEAVGPDALQVVSPSQAEKLGKDAKAIVGELAYTPDGEPRVGVKGDKRPPYVPRTAAQMFPS
jgi:Protein of unknown function (DUF2800)